MRADKRTEQSNRRSGERAAELSAPADGAEAFGEVWSAGVGSAEWRAAAVVG